MNLTPTNHNPKIDDVVVARNKQILAAMEKHFMDDPGSIEILTWKKLIELPMNDLYQVADGVHCRRVANMLYENVVLVFVEFIKGAYLPIHTHDCFEKYTVITGTLRGRKNKGIIKPYEPHDFRAATDILMVVEFYE